ncbi:MAG: Do family serine endopeptidase [bacterium]
MKKLNFDTRKKNIGLILLVFSTTFVAVFVYDKFFRDETTLVTNVIQPASLANYQWKNDTGEYNFISAAEKTIHAVVHVKTTTDAETYSNPLFDFFYGTQEGKKAEPVMGIGSGVIVSKEGYIVTNNHVIENSNEIIIKLNNNREYKAELIGSDPQTDLAVLKIDGKDLFQVPYGDSDLLRVGEWILAVGNPYNLTSTVTAGIVSAKGRNLGILDDSYRIESFIQTDAALNRGNSGGALVNLKGELVGVNTAIISPSGVYSGNSFAVPVNIVRKVVKDIVEYGEVQRALLGVRIMDVTDEMAKEKGLEKIFGVYVSGLSENGAAINAGIKADDIITSVNGVNVNSTAELQEQVSRYTPGEKVNIELIRDKKRKQYEVVLRNIHGDTGIVRAKEKLVFFGAKLQEINNTEKKLLNIEHGVKIEDLGSGKFKTAGIKEGFIITSINNQQVKDAADVKEIIDKIKGGVYIEGLYPNGFKAYYAFGR